MSTFFFVVQIVFGILSPLVVIGLVSLLGYVLVGYLEYLKILKEHKLELAKKEAPYDEVETSLNPMRKSLMVRFYKKNKLVWESEIKEGQL